MLEMIPGTLVWLTFILAAVLSFWKPLWVMYFIIIFSVYWLFRVFYFIFYLAVSWRRFSGILKLIGLKKFAACQTGRAIITS